VDRSRGKRVGVPCAADDTTLVETAAERVPERQQATPGAKRTRRIGGSGRQRTQGCDLCEFGRLDLSQDRRDRLIVTCSCVEE
jgi:hypothetical protein